VVTHETDVKVFSVHIPSILHVAVVGAASLWPFLSECSSVCDSFPFITVAGLNLT
jgi:hypothetical protein